MHESVMENETHKLLWDFVIQTDHPISARRSDLVIINNKKRTYRIVDSTVPADYWVKSKEIEKKDNYQDLARELKNTMEHESDGDNNNNSCSWYSHQRISAEIGGLGNKRTIGDHSNVSIIKIGQNTEKSPGDLRRLFVTQTPVEHHQLTLVWKAWKGCQHWRQRWRIDTTTRRLYTKTRWWSHYSHQKRCWYHDGQQNDNN